MQTEPVLLQTERLTRSFGSLTAVNAVDLAIQPGELRSIIGPNGAGKSTLFKLISGELAPTSGRVRFDGKDITGLPHFAVSRRGIAKSYQITTIFPGLSVLENVRLAVQCRRTVLDCFRRADRLSGVLDRARELLAAVELETKADEPAATIGHGLQRHLEIAIALACEPKLLLLDEPTAGMSPEETERTIALIRRIAAGRTVVVVEHKMKVVMEISDRITVLHQGAVLAEGTPAEIRAHGDVQAVYLGTRARRAVAAG
ncbi:MAG TPA: ABC transporter ATP-binding protein [Methylomirabilota bacterium]|nr:ABC transporter ATP-binding protein [Methylomirabilota bacterium]